MSKSPDKKKVVYIAGPISKGNLQQNVIRADGAFLALVRAGFAPINPMWSVFAGATEKGSYATNSNIVFAAGKTASSLPLTHADWIGLDLPLVERSDAVLRLPGESAGADVETAHAKEHGVPVFHTVADLVRHFAPEPDHVLKVGAFNDLPVGGVSVGTCCVYPGVRPSGGWGDVQPGDVVEFRCCEGTGKTSRAVVEEVIADTSLDKIRASFFAQCTDGGYEAVVARRKKLDGNRFRLWQPIMIFRYRRVA